MSELENAKDGLKKAQARANDVATTHGKDSVEYERALEAVCDWDAAVTMLLVKDEISVFYARDTLKGTRFAAALAAARDAATKLPKNPYDIFSAARASVISVVKLLMTLDLPPIPGSDATVYLWVERGRLVASITHRGYLTLAARAGIRVTTHTVFHGDKLELAATDAGIEYRLTPDFTAARDLANLTGVLTLITPPGATRPQDYHYATKAEIDTARNNKGGPWNQHGVAMAIKSAIKAANARGKFLIPDDAREVLREIEASEDDAIPLLTTTPAARTLEDALTPTAP